VGIKSAIKKTFSSGFQPKRWFGVDHVKANGKICVDLVSDLIATPKKSEDKIEALKIEGRNLQNDPNALRFRKYLALGLTFFYLLACFGSIFYGIYLISAKSFILPGCVSLVVSFLLFSYSLREFMAYAQIRSGSVKLPLKMLIKQALKGFPQSKK